MDFDYIVIGAGSAGCVIAAELSRDPLVTVALVEGGPSDRNFLVEMPRGIGKLLDPDNPRCSHYQVSRGIDGGEEIWLKGRTLGGSSSVNGLLYIRGHPADFDAWEAEGCAGWGWNDLLPCFLEIEHHELGASPDRGGEGPLKITVEAHSELGDALIRAAGEAGLEPVADVNAAYGDRVGYSPRTIWRGTRQSAAKAFLRPAEMRPNLYVMTETQVQRLTFEGRRATGVEAIGREGPIRLFARREVVVSAGAIESPKLLQLSGIGDPAHLRSLGIEPVVASPQVGQNLREHMVMGISFHVRRGSMNRQFQNWRLLRNVAQYALLKSGPMASCGSEVTGFFRSRPGLERPDCQLFGGLYSMVRKDGRMLIDSEPGVTLNGYVMHPESQGQVLIYSADPAVPPRVNANYLATTRDRETAHDMLAFLHRIASMPALQDYLVDPAVPSTELSDGELAALGTNAFHASSTCRMGADEQSVVDPQLQVRGVDGLRVADTSIFPTLISGNTNAAAMVVGLKASRMIMASWSGERRWAA